MIRKRSYTTLNEGNTNGMSSVTIAYQSLANAIILQAAREYKTALKRLIRYPNNAEAKSTARQIERFFRSDWYKRLTSLDCEIIINGIKEELLVDS